MDTSQNCQGYKKQTNKRLRNSYGPEDTNDT